MRFLVKLTISFLAASVAYAAPPAAESVERLLLIDGSQKVHELNVQGLDTMLTGGLRQILMTNTLVPAAMKNSSTYDAVMGKVIAQVKAEISWEKMKPHIIQSYIETYNQEEIDGLIAFYSSPTGQSFREKQPLATKRIAVLTSARVEPVIRRQLPEQIRLVTEANAAKR